MRGVDAVAVQLQSCSGIFCGHRYRGVRCCLSCVWCNLAWCRSVPQRPSNAVIHHACFVALVAQFGTAAAVVDEPVADLSHADAGSLYV